MATLHDLIASFIARTPVVDVPFIKDFPEELETKVHISSTELVNTVFQAIAELGIVRTEHRLEEHELFADAGGAQLCLINVNGLSDTWVKTKTRNTVRHTHGLRLPLVTRRSRKLKPSDVGYADAMAHSLVLPLVDTFRKYCSNIFFRSGSYIFSLSFSLVSNDRGFTLSEMEFEYEGRDEAAAPVSIQEAMDAFDTIFQSTLPFLIHLLHAQTKYEALRPPDRAL